MTTLLVLSLAASAVISQASFEEYTGHTEQALLLALIMLSLPMVQQFTCVVIIVVGQLPILLMLLIL